MIYTQETGHSNAHSLDVLVIVRAFCCRAAPSSEVTRLAQTGDHKNDSELTRAANSGLSFQTDYYDHRAPAFHKRFPAGHVIETTSS